MNLIDLIDKKTTLISLRNHIGKALESDLSMSLKQRKLDEFAAHVLGARDWNTALGIVESAESIQDDTSESLVYNVNADAFIALVDDYVAIKKDPNFINTLQENLASLMGMRDVLPNYSYAIASLCSDAEGSNDVAHILIDMGIEASAIEELDFMVHFTNLTLEQRADALACCYDAKHEPVDDVLTAFYYDSKLRDRFLEYYDGLEA